MDNLDELFDELNTVLEHVKAQKPDNRSEIDRRFAILITDLEKVRAYFFTYILTVFSDDTQ